LYQASPDPVSPIPAERDALTDVLRLAVMPNCKNSCTYAAPATVTRRRPPIRHTAWFDKCELMGYPLPERVRMARTETSTRDLHLPVPDTGNDAIDDARSFPWLEQTNTGRNHMSDMSTTGS
jgi:hypothetical protein